MVPRSRVKPDPACVARQDRPPKETAADAVELRDAVLDLERRFDPSDLLAQQADALELQDPLHLNRNTIRPTAHVIELPVDMLERDPSLDCVIVENDQRVLPLAPGGRS